MAFPTISVASDELSFGTGPRTCTIPTPSAGDLVLIITRVDNGISTSASGWTEIASVTAIRSTLVLARICNGTEGSTVSVSHSASASFAYVSIRLSGVFSTSTLSDVVTAQTAARFGGQQPDSPSVTAGWAGTPDNTFIAVAGAGAMTAGPSNYRNAALDTPPSFNYLNLGVSWTIAYAFRQLAAQTDDPSAWDNGGNGGECITMVVRPVGGATDPAGANRLVRATSSSTQQFFYGS